MTLLFAAYLLNDGAFVVIAATADRSLVETRSRCPIVMEATRDKPGHRLRAAIHAFC
jgi:hypothetical protein